LEETGLDPGFKQCGSVNVARTPERMEVLARGAMKARAFGQEAHLLSAAECGERMKGVIATDDLVGGVWLPGDGSGSPTDLTMALLAGAKNRGVKVHEGVRVENFDIKITNNGARRVHGVTLESGEAIEAEVVVVCAGQWSRQLAAKAGVNAPLHSAEHFYVITDPIDGVTLELPVCRDPDALIYFREWSGGLCVGGFELDAKPVFGGKTGVPDDFAFGLLPDDWDQFMPLYEGAAERIPALERTGIATFLNGPESFTQDGHYILGEAPTCDGLFVCAGMNSSGIASSGGAGYALAEWIDTGASSTDLWGVDIKRFVPDAASGNLDFLRGR